MRRKSSAGALSVQAVAGTHVVTLGFDVARDSMPGALGFGIERIDHTEGERTWLDNRLRFAGAKRSWGSDRHPLQTFAWGDYRAKPDHTYTYNVHLREGTPNTALSTRDVVSVRVSTESPDAHRIWFNRGVIASQAYAERFRNRDPRKVENNAAWKWLSRGLEEALLGFIGQAVDERWALHGALYECRYPPVLEAFRIAAESGADVNLVVHDAEANRAAVSDAGVDHLITKWRKRAVIPHNKFIVASMKDAPTSVWTGSTNITENGIFGQSNVGHEVHDARIVSLYRSYWDNLAKDPTPGKLDDWVEEHTPLPTRWRRGTTVLFSPRSSLDALDSYAQLFASAKRMACATFPFNLDRRFAEQLAGDYKALRWLLFETKSRAEEYAPLVSDPDTELVAGAVVPPGNVAGWMSELDNPMTTNIDFIHTKYMLIDPLGEDPVVVTGSANFSEASTRKNDENMLVIRGNQGVADIYFSEFFRLFNHYRFRQLLRLHPSEVQPGPETKTDAPRTLRTDDSWWPKYFDEPARAKQRKLLAGT